MKVLGNYPIPGPARPSQKIPQVVSQEPTDQVDLTPTHQRSGWSAPLALLKTVNGNPSGDPIALACSVAQTQHSQGGWGEAPGAQVDHDSSLLNHLALTTYLRRVEHAREFGKTYTREERALYTPDEPTQKTLELALKKSWVHLSGEVPGDTGALLGEIDGKALNQAAGCTWALHQALLGDSLEVRIDPDQAINTALTEIENALPGGPLEAQPKRSSGLRTVAAVATAGATALALYSGGLKYAAAAAPLVAGAALGWMAASFNESLVHDKVLHVRDLPEFGKSTNSVVSQIYSAGPSWVQQPIYSAWFGHTKIHHYQTFKQDHVTQFRNDAERAKLDTYLMKKGEERLIDEEYGATLGWDGYVRFQAVASPTYTAAMGAAYALGAGPAFAVGFTLPAVIFPLFSKEYHRYTHMPAKKALATASPPMRAFLKSPMSRHILRHHFVHHVDDHVNFNLMPGGDWLRGTLQKPTVGQEEEMRRLKVLW